MLALQPSHQPSIVYDRMQPYHAAGSYPVHDAAATLLLQQLHQHWNDLHGIWSITNSYNNNRKHLKNVGPIRHCEPPHAHSPDVVSGTVARRLRIDIHDIDNDNDDNDNDNA